MRVAHQYGITPEVVFTGGNVIVHRFVEGRVLRAGDINGNTVSSPTWSSAAIASPLQRLEAIFVCLTTSNT